MTQLSRNEAIAKLRELHAACRSEQWCNAEIVRREDGQPYESQEEILDGLRVTLSKSETTRLYGVTLETEDADGSAPVVCHTGNGPTSAAHAEFITCVKNWLPQLLDDFEEALRIKTGAEWLPKS